MEEKDKEKSQNLNLILLTLGYDAFVLGIISGFLYEASASKIITIIGIILLISVMMVKKPQDNVKINKTLFAICIGTMALSTLIAMIVICVIIITQPVFAITTLVIIFIAIYLLSKKKTKNWVDYSVFSQFKAYNPSLLLFSQPRKYHKQCRATKQNPSKHCKNRKIFSILFINIFNNIYTSRLFYYYHLSTI